MNESNEVFGRAVCVDSDDVTALASYGAFLHDVKHDVQAARRYQ